MVTYGRVLLLAFLLLSMQREMVDHALQHDRARLADSQPALHAPADGPCVVCALFAGGTHAVTSQAPAVEVLGVALPSGSWLGRSATPRAPSFYSSRAPPSLL